MVSLLRLSRPASPSLLGDQTVRRPPILGSEGRLERAQHPGLDQPGGRPLRRLERERHLPGSRGRDHRAAAQVVLRLRWQRLPDFAEQQVGVDFLLGLRQYRFQDLLLPIFPS